MAVVMDGNGRWAEDAESPRVGAGHCSVHSLIEAAPRMGITTFTLFGFSTDRSTGSLLDVNALADVLLTHSVDAVRGSGQVRLSVIGYRHDLSPTLRRAIASAEAATVAGRGLHLRLALNYSTRRSIVLAAERMRAARDVPGAAAFDVPDVDLLIRTGGEQRVSHFLPWECANAELLFVPKMWPDFTPADLAAAVAKFRQRKRRFGRTPEQVSA